MSEEDSTREPRWLTHFFLATACLAAAAVSAALILGWRQGHVHYVADFVVNLGGRPVHEHCTTGHPEGGMPAAPWLDRSSATGRMWFSRDRRWLDLGFVLLFLSQIALIIVGRWLRGPNWTLVWPF